MARIDDLIQQITDEELRNRIQDEAKKLSKQKTFGLVFEEHLPECSPLYDIPVSRGKKVAQKTVKEIKEVYTVIDIQGEKAICIKSDDEESVEINIADLVVIAEFGEPIYPYLKPIDSVCNAPESELWHTLIEADNYHALQLLEYLYAGKVDCIYIDPPYNTGARDWKYNNNYVDGSDSYRHSKWLSFMDKRLKLAKKLLNPKDSVLIVTIDEKEYLHLGCLLEELFPTANIQMISDVINPKGVARSGFRRNDEYIFFVMIGSSQPARLPLSPEWSSSATRKEDNTSTTPDWTSMMRRGSNSSRKHSPGCYYPIYVEPNTKRIMKIGDALPEGKHRGEDISGLIQVLPIRTNGDEGCWQVSPSELYNRMKQGRIKVGRETSYGFVINYLPDGAYAAIMGENWSVEGLADDGSIIAFKKEDIDESRVAPTQWKIASHNASENGSSFINKILNEDRFTYPKSIYAEHDAIRFFVANKPDALIVDFFAGSGTTMHAVNLLNAEDGGNRRCIMVTNNEVSDSEEKDLRKRGYYPGDEEWEKLGIARFVTWERTKCSITGKDVKGVALSGSYGVDIETFERAKGEKKGLYKKIKKAAYPELASMKFSDGFKANAAFFKLGFLDKDAVARREQLKELMSVLWMKSGCFGECPVIDDNPDMIILPENRFALLNKESSFLDFEEKLQEHPEIETVFIVTDSENAYRRMIAGLPGKTTYQLYRDYLDNFRINTAR